MLYVEPAGGSPDMFNRGFKYLFFAQQATADKQGQVFAEWVAEPARGPAAEDRGVPDPRRPVRGAQRRRHPRDPRGAGIQTVYQETYAIDTKNFDTHRQRDEVRRPRPGRARRAFEDGVGLTRAMLKAGFTPDVFYQTNAPVASATSTPRPSARRTPRASSTPSATRPRRTPRATRSSWRSTRRCSAALPPEDAADAYAAAQVLQAAVEAVGSIDDQRHWPTGCATTRSTTILGPLRGTTTGARRATS